jgi:hypothetical protein
VPNPPYMLTNQEEMQMTLQNEGAARAGGETDFSYVTAPESAPAAMSTTQAARIVANLRQKSRDQTDQAPLRAGFKPAPAAVSTPESEAAPTAAAEDAAPAQQPSGETEATEPEANALPPIEPPRFWSKDAKERWASLPRETQAYLAEREQERDREVRRTQNEAADKLKGLAAKEQAAEQARLHYEAALPQLLQTLQAQQQGEFGDIKSIADVERLAREDWPRYLQRDLAQKKLAAVQQQMRESQQRQNDEQERQFSEFARSQDHLFTEKVSDMGDPEKAAKLRSAAVAVLKDLGFDEAELSQTWNGKRGISLRDHRVQLLIRDATLWREAQQKAKAATARPVPPVQRPGVAQSKSASAQAEIQSLQKQLETATGVGAMRIAARLTAARRAQAR